MNSNYSQNKVMNSKNCQKIKQLMNSNNNQNNLMNSNKHKTKLMTSNNRHHKLMISNNYNTN